MMYEGGREDTQTALSAAHLSLSFHSTFTTRFRAHSTSLSAPLTDSDTGNATSHLPTLLVPRRSRLLVCHQVIPRHREILVRSTHNRQHAEDMEYEAAATEERGGVRAGEEEEGDRGTTACAER